MKSDSVFSTMWKLSLCAIVFVVGMVINRVISRLLVFNSFAKFLGTDGKTLVFSLVLFSVLIPFLAFQIFRRLRLNWFLRVVIVAEVIWILELVGVCVCLLVLLPSISLVSIITSILFLVNFLLPNLLVCGLAVILFSPTDSRPFRFPVKHSRLAPRIQSV